MMDTQQYKDTVLLTKALAHEKRLLVLSWLKKPREHFPKQRDGSRVRDGVCLSFISQKLNVSDATASQHLKLLHQVELVQAKRVGKWTFYRRDEKAIKLAMKALARSV